MVEHWSEEPGVAVSIAARGTIRGNMGCSICGWMNCENCGEGFTVYYESLTWNAEEGRINGADDESTILCTECFKKYAVIDIN